MKMGKLVSACVLSAAVTACGSASPPPAPSLVSVDTANLPGHIVVADEALPPKGRRIQLGTYSSTFTRDQCTALINAYRPRAAPRGQVSVVKPSKLMHGALSPWCVDNLDGKGVAFIEDMFRE